MVMRLKHADDIQRQEREEERQRAHNWQNAEPCAIHHIRKRWDITKAIAMHPQSDVERALCFVCDLCEMERKRDTACTTSLSANPGYQAGSIVRAFSHAQHTYEQEQINRAVLSAITTYPTSPEQSGAFDMSALAMTTPYAETRQALFSDVPHVSMLWNDDDEDDVGPTELRRIVKPARKTTSNLPPFEIWDYLIESREHEQETGENERLHE